MHPVARQALENLLKRGERAAVREGSRAVRLPFTQNSFPAYFSVGLRAELDDVHAGLREAARAGAILIDWDPGAGENGQITRLKLADIDALAKVLGRRAHTELVCGAEHALSPWGQNTAVQRILSAWKQLRKVRGKGVENVADLVDALRVLDYCGERPDEDIAVRSASAVLFKSSKRLEGLIPWLDVLTSEGSEGLSTTTRSAEEVLASLGLVKHPPAVLLAGSATLTLRDQTRMQVPAPFVGLAPASIDAVELPDTVRKIVTVENLTPFHELAVERAGRLEDTLILYTAGMPAPSFLRFYRGLLLEASRRTVLHWGDIDPGGFRIARILAEAAAECAVELKPWRMCSDDFDAKLSYRPLSGKDLKDMRTVCKARGWAREEQALVRRPLAFEQEALSLELP